MKADYYKKNKKIKLTHSQKTVPPNLDAEPNPSFRILVIDDNESIHNDFAKILESNNVHSDLENMDAFLFSGDIKSEKKPLEILTASQGKEGYKIIEREYRLGNPIALAFIDIRMPPGWDGIETIKKIWKIDPDIQIVICTAYSDYGWHEIIANLGESDNLLILRKPFDSIMVRQLAFALTKKWHLTQQAKKQTATLEATVKERTKSLEHSLSLVKATFESTSDGILVVDSKRRIVDYNSNFARILNVPSDIIESKDDVKLCDYLNSKLAVPTPTFLRKIDTLYRNLELVSIDEIKFKDHKIFERYSRPQILENKTIGRIWSYRDITMRAKLESKLQHQASHDDLTGLPNRRFLYNHLKHLIADGTCNQFAILFLDLNRFKLINDSFNHAVGDEVLKAVSDRLQSTLRQGDVLTRIGGDEFVIVLPHIQHENINIVTQKIFTSLSKPLAVDHHEVVITTSIGISFYPNDGDHPDELLRKADIAMYTAKQSGNNQCKAFVESAPHAGLNRLENEADLRHALDNHEFYLEYQPQYNLETNEIIAVEALIRWQHPTKGTIMPTDFIWLAEDTNLIIPIGDWVLETACKQNKYWQDTYHKNLRIAVNISERQLDGNFVEKVKMILDKTGLAPDQLEIELTESIVITHQPIHLILTELQQLGINIALDDFGTGYTNLMYLKTVHLDKLKIDKCFIQDLTNPTGEKIIINAIKSMAENLGIQVLIEGVENPEQVAIIEDTGCRQVQGFYYNKPMSANEISKIIAK